MKHTIYHVSVAWGTSRTLRLKNYKTAETDCRDSLISERSANKTNWKKVDKSKYLNQIKTASLFLKTENTENYKRKLTLRFNSLRSQKHLRLREAG